VRREIVRRQTSLPSFAYEYDLLISLGLTSDQMVALVRPQETVPKQQRPSPVVFLSGHHTATLRQVATGSHLRSNGIYCLVVIIVVQ
jgi:hypothetical protein